MLWLERKRLDFMEFTVSRLRQIAGMGSATARAEHLATGEEGETAAFFFLRNKGYTVVARRWGSPSQRGDLDLIAWLGPVLCVIEVKTRTAHDLAAAEVAVDAHKRAVLRKLARKYVAQLPGKTRPPVRFDILSVYMEPHKAKEFVHFEAAFGWTDGEQK